MFKLRKYQQEIINATLDSMRKGNKKILIMAPTGAGKTIIAKYFAELSNNHNKNFLFTVHRRQLCQQTAEKFSNLNPGIIMGSEKEDRSRNIQIGTIQTLSRRDLDNPDLIMIDEVHFGFKSSMIQGIIEQFPESKIVGLSATPIDERGYLLEGFDDIIDIVQMCDLIKDKWLTPLICYSPIQIDLSKVSVKSTGDYKEDELEKEVNKEILLNTIVDNYKKYTENRQFLCFCVNKQHAIDMADCFNKRGYKVKAVYADMKEEERINIYEDFKNEKLDGITNIEILTAGTDFPNIRCVIGACPTKSLRKYIQMVGRGVRLNGRDWNESIKNGKVDCVFLDCGNMIMEHDMPDIRRKYTFKPKISKVIDKQLKIDEHSEERKDKIELITEERMVFLKKIGSLLDLYEEKQYKKESELQDDVNNFLKKTGYFWWRQNSGKAYMQGRWVHFASKSGLPDNTMFFNYTSLYIGIELKLPWGKLTTHQKITLPEMIQKGILVYICESVMDVYEVILHLEKNIIKTKDGLFIKNEVYDLWQKQIDYRKKLKLPLK